MSSSRSRSRRGLEEDLFLPPPQDAHTHTRVLTPEQAHTRSHACTHACTSGGLGGRGCQRGSQARACTQVEQRPGAPRVPRPLHVPRCPGPRLFRALQPRSRVHGGVLSRLPAGPTGLLKRAISLKCGIDRETGAGLKLSAPRSSWFSLRKVVRK